MGVLFPESTGNEVATKRTVLSTIASVFDPLSITSPVSVSGKMIYRGVCDCNLPWDKELPNDIMKCWKKWREKFPDRIEVRLAKKGLKIPRLELVSGQMVMKLLYNVKALLDGLPVGQCYGWLDSMVALSWINGCGNYKQLVNNLVKLIREKSYITRRHAGTKENPADIGSRGCYADQLPEKWLD